MVWFIVVTVNKQRFVDFFNKKAQQELSYLVKARCDICFIKLNN